MNNVVSVRLSDDEIERIDLFRQGFSSDDIGRMVSRNKVIRSLLNWAIKAKTEAREAKEEISNP